MTASPMSRLSSELARLLTPTENDLLTEALRAEGRLGNPRPWIEANLWILNKERRLAPFSFNDVQADYYEHRTAWDIILKPRQLGFTTLITGLFFADCLNIGNTTSVMMAHDLQSTEQIFQIAKLFWVRLPESERRRVGTPKYDNRREFYWEKIGSRFLVGTAGSTKFGRGLTINNLHCSEFAFWPKPQETLAALTEAVPAGGRMVIESTANGMGYFHDLWQAANEEQNRFNPVYYVWWEDSSYRAAPEPAEIDLWGRQLAEVKAEEGQ